MEDAKNGMNKKKDEAPSRSRVQGPPRNVLGHGQVNASSTEGNKHAHIGGFFEMSADLKAVQRPTWKKIEVVMDSGAAESVGPPDMAPWLPIKESPGSRAGWKYIYLHCALLEIMI